MESVFRSGDIDYRYESRERLVEGTLGHQKLQRKFKKLASEAGFEYKPEVSINYCLEYRGFDFRIDGRIDGVELSGDKVTIDEIKTTVIPIEELDGENIVHWAQAECYAYFYMVQNELHNIDIRLIYYNIDSDQAHIINKSYGIDELETFFYGVLEKYYVWVKMQYDWCVKRNASIKALQFPFYNYRKGQRQLAVAVYKTITGGKKLFAQAPTGIGKTISTLFPAIKAIGEEEASKLFYLTAKTITRQVAESTAAMLLARGLYFRTITITAKDKICFMDKAVCSPEECIYAKGHYDRVNAAVSDIIENNGIMTRAVVEEYAARHKVCPYEFSLDIALFADCIICDYNYAFDPRVQLKRFFADKGGDYVFLIDEAHNLVDRARSMYSAELWKRPFLQLKRIMKNKNAALSKTAGKINLYMLELKKQCGTGGAFILDKPPGELYELLFSLAKALDKQLPLCERGEEQNEVLDVYFASLTFLRIAELYDERYFMYAEKEAGDIKLRMLCIDPSKLLGDTFEKGKAAVLFSATLMPIDYYRELLGGTAEDYRLKLASPYDRKQLCLLLCGNVSTKYKNRAGSYDEVTGYIEALACTRTGNFIAYFPSYKYMEEISGRFAERHPEIKMIVQKPFMDEKDKEDFLQEFRPEPQETLLGFAVMGGVFSEGIDLTGDRLSGVAIVGVGLPQLCMERDIISSYYQKLNGLGYQYSYMFPGMNKVLQAAGRVIRSENDRGVVMLIDDRYNRYDYLKLFPGEWDSYQVINSASEAGRSIKRFWKLGGIYGQQI